MIKLQNIFIEILALTLCVYLANINLFKLNIKLKESFEII